MAIFQMPNSSIAEKYHLFLFFSNGLQRMASSFNVVDFTFVYRGTRLWLQIQSFGHEKNKLKTIRGESCIRCHGFFPHKRGYEWKIY